MDRQVEQSRPDNDRQPWHVRLPGFLAAGEIGLGDAIKHTPYALGIRSCKGCDARAQALNRWAQLPGRGPFSIPVRLK